MKAALTALWNIIVQLITGTEPLVEAYASMNRGIQSYASEFELDAKASTAESIKRLEETLKKIEEA